MADSPYSFRPAAGADLPMFQRWLCTPEPRRWWGDPVHEYSLLEEDLGNPGMTMLVVSYQGVPFAYAQHYEVHTWPQPHLSHLPAGSRAIDAFIGVPEMLGVGHGTAFLRLLALELKAAGVPVIAIDPDVGNFRARRAYEKAGFRGDTVVNTEAGPVVLMLFGG
jgi:aminoglycoside 6'-N-acetyltransferase